MTKFKAGDQVQPTAHARINYKFDTLGIKLPITVLNVYRISGIEYVQFMAPEIYLKHGGMIMRTWSARNLELYNPKPRLKQVCVGDLQPGDTFYNPFSGNKRVLFSLREHSRGMAWLEMADRRTANWQVDLKVWREVRANEKTTLQKETGVPSGNRRPDTCQGDGWKTTHIQTLGRGLRLDARSRVSHACESERECNASRDVESVPESGTPLRMTLGRYLKSGNYIAFEVKNDGAYPYYVVGGVGHIINPDQYFKVVKPITKT